MVAETRSMEIITTRTEVEALLLESNLIKTLKPRFNILLRDDKSFPYIMITRDHEWAQINKHRGTRKRKAWWFGPFASASAVNRTVTELTRAFLLRNCSDSVFSTRTDPVCNIRSNAAPPLVLARSVRGLSETGESGRAFSQWRITDSTG